MQFINTSLKVVTVFVAAFGFSASSLANSVDFDWEIDVDFSRHRDSDSSKGLRERNSRRPNAYNAFGNNYSVQSRVRVSRDGVIRGWVCDEYFPRRSTEAHIYVGGPAGEGELVERVLANDYNSQAPSKANCDGNHGFEYRLPRRYLHRSVEVYVYGINLDQDPLGNPLLVGTPVRINGDSHRDRDRNRDRRRPRPRH